MPQVTHFSSEQKYEMQQTLQPGDQMWVNFADLIRRRVPDRKVTAVHDLEASPELQFLKGSALSNGHTPWTLADNQSRLCLHDFRG